MKSCCVTGHRPQKLGGYALNSTKALNARVWLAHNIARAYTEGYRHFISGMAQGTDQIFAELVLSAKKSLEGITLTAAVPHTAHEFPWPDTAKKYYWSLSRQCDEVVTVTDDTYHLAYMQKRNMWMIDRSDLVLAVWDGSAGGTKNALLYAYKNNRIIRTFNPQFSMEGQLEL